MQLSIIIINYNTFRLTVNCIRSVREKLDGLEYEIILVDNASAECDPEEFLRECPGIVLIKSATNTGFAGGNNLGIANSRGTYILLLNSDTELINNAPKICYDYISTRPAVGMVTCQLLYPDGSIQYNCRKFRTIGWELAEVFPFFRLMPKEKQGRLMLHHYFDHQSPAECDWVWGAFMLFPREILSKLPDHKLAEDFFMYIEDVRWCWDFKRLGYAIHFLPDGKVMHIHKASIDPGKLKQTRKTGIENHAQFMKKFYPDWRWYIFAAIFYTKQYGGMWVKGLFR